MVVDQYVGDKGCTSGADGSECFLWHSYGWPIDMWCVSEVVDMSTLFSNHECINDGDKDLFDDDLYVNSYVQNMIHCLTNRLI